MSDVARRRGALVVFLATIALIVVALLSARGLAHQRGINGQFRFDGGVLVNAFAFAATALLLIWARPRNAVGWQLALAGVLGAACEAGQDYGTRAVVLPAEHLPLGTLALSLSAPLWVPMVLIPVTTLLVRYPGGSVASGWSRRVDRMVTAGFVLFWLVYAGSPNSVTDSVVGRLPPIEVPRAVGVVALPAGSLAVLGGALAIVVLTIRRMLRATFPERQQLAWLITAGVIGVVVVWVDPTRILGSVAFAFVPVAVVVGVLRYRLLGIEVVLRRTLLYGTLTGLVLVVFVAVTAGLAALLPSGPAPTVVATSLVAFLLPPARDRVQKVVDRFVYGDRRDPLTALTRLGTPVAGASDVAALPAVVAAVADALRVPGAAVVGVDGVRVAEHGTVGHGPAEVPLRIGGVEVGHLVVSARRGEAVLSRADQQLLAALAPLVAVVLRSVSLTEDLRRERQRVLEATHAERRRLRQELHDGLGPSLTGVALGLEAAESNLGGAPESTREIVGRSRAEVTGAIEEIRRIIDDLRPTALDEQDLVGALRRRTGHVGAGGGLAVDLRVPTQLPALPPEVESAAFRIADEALNNVVRHARASSCTVELTVDDVLRLEVRDDGIGLTARRSGGVGLDSMRERAERLGGTFRARHGEGGTAVVVEIPVARPA